MFLQESGQHCRLRPDRKRYEFGGWQKPGMNTKPKHSLFQYVYTNFSSDGIFFVTRNKGSNDHNKDNGVLKHTTSGASGSRWGE